MDDERPKIHVSRGGPYVVEGLQELKDSKSSSVEIEGVIALCRCGSNRTFCDGTHGKIGFSGLKDERRKPDRLEIYKGQRIWIHDNRGVCSHRGYCTDELPSVFRGGKEPWIDPDGASIEEIIGMCEKCPSGALSYSLPEGQRFQAVNGRGPAINISPKRYGADGPYDIVGSIELNDPNGEIPESEEHYTLCRCGGSKNKPFCDGTHWHIDYDEKTAHLSRNDRMAPEHRREERFDNKMDTVVRLRDTGESLISSMRTLERFPDWRSIMFKGAQLARFPLNRDENVETRTVIGPDAERPLEMSMPFYVSHMSFGALSKEAKVALAKGSKAVDTAMCSGEGGFLPEERKEAAKWIYEISAADFTRNPEAIRQADAIEVKIGQAVKPGMGGILPREKVTSEISQARNIPLDQDSHAPARFSDFNSPEEARGFIDELRGQTGGGPIGVKIAAGHIEEDLDFVLKMSPDFITIDCRGGATGAAPNYVKDNSGVPPVFALHRARKFLDERGSKTTLCITGGFRDSSDIAKALAMGADAVALATASLISIGCRQSRVCNTGRCPVGIATQDPALRRLLDQERSVQGFINYYTATKAELENIARMMGRSSVHDLDGNDVSTISAEVAVYTDIEHV